MLLAMPTTVNTVSGGEPDDSALVTARLRRHERPVRSIELRNRRTPGQAQNYYVSRDPS
jgi:hypothetical protein